MTPELATQLAAILIDSLQQHQLTDIASFLPSSSIYNNFQDDYFDSDLSWSKIAGSLTKEGIQNNNPRETLIQLTEAISAYFTLASKLPDKYRTIIKKLSERIDQPIEATPIIMQTVVNDNLNIGSLMESESVRKIIELADFIQENESLDDFTFMNKLDNIL